MQTELFTTNEPDRIHIYHFECGYMFHVNSYKTEALNIEERLRTRMLRNVVCESFDEINQAIKINSRLRIITKLNIQSNEDNVIDKRIIL